MASMMSYELRRYGLGSCLDFIINCLDTSGVMTFVYGAKDIRTYPYYALGGLFFSVVNLVDPFSKHAFFRWRVQVWKRTGLVGFAFLHLSAVFKIPQKFALCFSFSSSFGLVREG